MIKIESSTASPSKKNIYKRTAILAGSGAAIGGSVAYYLQKKAIAEDKAAKEAAANRTITQKTIVFFTSELKKLWNSAKSLGGKVKTNYKESIDNVIKTGKISKTGIAKAAILTAIALPVIDFARKFELKKPEQIQVENNLNNEQKTA